MCCDCFVDPDHPKKKTAVCLKIVLLLMCVIGIVVFAVSVYFAVNLKKIGGFAVVVAITGVAIVTFSIVGLCGSGYSPVDTEGFGMKKVCLRIFWLAVLIIIVVLWLIGLVCIISRSTIEYYVVMNIETYEEVINDLPENAGKNYAERIDYWVGNVIAVGIMALSVGAILIFPWLLVSYLMGLRTFLATLGLYGSCVISLLGILVIAIVAYFYAYVAIAKNYSGLLVGVIVLGVILMLLGVFGVVGFALEERTKLPIRAFGLLLILILLAFLIIAIVAFAASGSLRTVVDKGISKYCGLGEVEKNEDNAPAVGIKDSKCYPIVQSVIRYLCNDSDQGNLDPCPKTFEEKNHCSCEDNLNKVEELTKNQFYDATAEYTVLLLQGNYIVVGVVGFLVVAYLLIMVVTVLYACCVPKREKLSGLVEY